MNDRCPINPNCSIGPLRRSAIPHLREAGIDCPELECDLLLAYSCGCSRIFLLTHPDAPVTEEQQQHFWSVIQRRCRQEPIQYILQTVEFMGLSFRLSPDVLIPRQDTETLVEAAREWIDTQSLSFLDLCTGSGCIALSILAYCPNATAVATDISSAALQVALQNAQDHLLTARIRFQQGDLWDALPEGSRFPVICSNPPYIPSSVVTELQPQVRCHEPLQALDGGTDGLLFYSRIIQKAPCFLQEGGKLFLEIGFGQQEDVEKLLSAAGFRNIETRRDLNGISRVLIAS